MVRPARAPETLREATTPQAALAKLLPDVTLVDALSSTKNSEVIGIEPMPVYLLNSYASVFRSTSETFAPPNPLELLSATRAGIDRLGQHRHAVTGGIELVILA